MTATNKCQPARVPGKSYLILLLSAVMQSSTRRFRVVLKRNAPSTAAEFILQFSASVVGGFYVFTVSTRVVLIVVLLIAVITEVPSVVRSPAQYLSLSVCFYRAHHGSAFLLIVDFHRALPTRVLALSAREVRLQMQ